MRCVGRFCGVDGPADPHHGEPFEGNAILHVLGRRQNELRAPVPVIRGCNDEGPAMLPVMFPGRTSSPAWQ